MNPVDAAQVLMRSLHDPTKPMTVADASVASGLAQRDAEAALHWLTSEYRGHLRVTEDGHLVHIFPHGFSKPWETREAAWVVLSSIGRALLGAGRFIVRAWLLIAMVFYALAFVALIVAFTFARQSDDRDNGGSIGGAMLGGLVRALADALFWTFHPFSPMYMAYDYDSIGAGSFGYGDMRGSPSRGQPTVPFYERVNRFVFGPIEPKPDPHAMRARILEEIRAMKGRIGLADVMRVTGLPREQADPLMARLMLDHEGSVDVAEQGGIFYRFEGLRKSAQDTRSASASASRVPASRPRAAWDTPKRVPALTGNDPSSNIMIAGLNGFNLIASAWMMSHAVTIANIPYLLAARTSRFPQRIVLPDSGTPLVFGLIPFVFSAALFVLPVTRWFLSKRRARSIARENARLAILREVLARAPKKQYVADETLRAAFRKATGEDPSSKEITARVVELGGDVVAGPNGEIRYRFADLEAEAEAVRHERALASDDEVRLGSIAFSSDD